MKTLISVAAVLITVCFGASCGQPGPEPLTGPDPEDLLREIEKAPTIKIAPQEVAEAFALWSDATDLQRELIEEDLIGSVVEWEIRVYDVSLSEGIYRILSRPIEIRSEEAVPLLRVIALVHAQNEMDRELLRMIKTDDVVLIRGMVRDVLLRVVIVIDPAVPLGRQAS